MRRILLAPIVLLALAQISLAQNWPQFRGPNSSPVAENPNLPHQWTKTQNVAWSVEIPGRGWSSPIVWGDRVFVTAVINDKTPKPRKGLYVSDLFGKIPPGEHRWMVYCVDLKTGKIRWSRSAHKGRPMQGVHIKNTYASETSVTDGERVYAYFGNLGLYCFDAGGKRLWTKQFRPRKTKLGWGTGSSPSIHKGVIYLVNDNEEESFLAAVNGRSGKELWRVPRDEKSNWSTPFIWKNSLRTEIITCGRKKVRSYDRDGKQLWQLGGMSSIVIPTPSAKGDILYVTSGYVGDFARRPVFAIKPGASGDISLKQGENNNKHIIWRQRFAGPYHPSPLVYGDYYYVLLDRGFLSCYDAKTGKIVYHKQRLPASEFTASPWAYNGKIFCQSEDGETFAVKAGAKFKLLERNSLEEMTLATPAIAGDSLLLRTQSRLYRIIKKP